MMMFSVSMRQSEAPDQKSNKHHARFKINVIQNINAE